MGLTLALVLGAWLTPLLGRSTTVQAASITSPLRVLASNPHYFTDGSGKAILLAGSHTWNDFQDMGQNGSPVPFDFTSYVTFLTSHGQNMTILWKKDLPTECNWGAGGTWQISPFPWPRTGPGTATDGQPKFDLSQFNQAYFDRLRARVVQLLQNNIYATVQLFDGLNLLNNRCATDGYPFTGANNINGIDDGGGTNSMTMTAPNAITQVQDAYVKKVIDTLNDLPNVLWEVSEEAPSNSTWWQNHMIGLIHSYEATKPYQHPVGYPMLTGGSDATLYASAADWVAPSARISPVNNQGKVIINDSDHSYYGMWNDSAQTNRNYLWENFTNGSSVLFMDPYEIYWASGNRNLCPNPVNGVCSGVDPRWNNVRDNLGYILSYAKRMNLAAMTPQGTRTSTGYALANTAATGSEYLVYAPSGGTFTVNLSTTLDSLRVEWFNPASGATTAGGTVPGGSSSQSFTPPFSGDAVLYLADTSSSSVAVGTGWNLLDLPLYVGAISSASSLLSGLEATGQLGPGSITVLATYGTGRFSIYLPGYSTDQPLQRSQGVLVLSTRSGTWTVSGTSYATGQPVQLQPGWNLVGAPYPPGGLDGTVINQEIGSGCRLQEVAQYSRGSYQTYTPGQSGTFHVPATSGMWIECTQPYSWTPS